MVIKSYKTDGSDARSKLRHMLAFNRLGSNTALTVDPLGTLLHFLITINWNICLIWSNISWTEWEFFFSSKLQSSPCSKVCYVTKKIIPKYLSTNCFLKLQVRRSIKLLATLLHSKSWPIEIMYHHLLTLSHKSTTWAPRVAT